MPSRMYEVRSGLIHFSDHGLWLSLVERFVRDEEAAGSNPASPTNLSLYRQDSCKAQKFS